MSEITKAVGQWIVDNVGLSVLIFLVLLSGLFKITKIEINPIGWIISSIGKLLTKSLRDDVDSKMTAIKQDLEAIDSRSVANCNKVNERLDKIEESNDMQTIRQIKAHVLDFANSCMNHRKHTKKDFDNIIDENTQYESLVTKYGLKNDVYKEDYAYIMKVYHYCQDNNCFLQEGCIEAN